MGFNTNELKDLAVAAIVDNDLIFIEEVITYLPCSKETFYNHRLHEHDDIKAAMNKVKVSRKKKMRDKWYESENATLQISAYKLLASEEELRRLSVTKNEMSGPEGKPIETEINLSKLTNEELAELERLAKLASDTKGDSKA